MLTLGIETSCDETSVAVTSGRMVLANAVSSSVHFHKRYGGVVPEIASRFHVEYIIEVLSKALEGSGKGLNDMDLIAVTAGPGLVGALLAGISMAKAVSYALKRPLVGVNHIQAHLYSAFLGGEERLEFPFIGLVVSGGHTVLFHCKGIDHQKLLGQTEDDAAGEAYDKVAKILSLGYPGGPVIERMARLSRVRNSTLFPKSFMGKDSLDFSFSGIKTAVLYYVRKLYDPRSRAKRREASPKGTIPDPRIHDIAYAFQESVLDVLVEKAFLAARMKGLKRIVVGGGVTANRRLREKFLEAASFSGAVRVYFPKMEYSMDNAAMVGALGEALYRKGRRSDIYLSAEPNLSS